MINIDRVWSTDAPPESLYIHWPFCKNKCHYCDFVAFEGHNSFEGRYHEKLCQEMEQFAALFADKPQIKTMFFGGGTPSLYPPDLMRDFFARLNNAYDLSHLKEASIEVNPGGIDDERLQLWRELGINRLSMGVQVLDEEVLFGLNRKQKTADVLDLLERAPKYFDNISADLILGLPGVTEEKWWETLATVTSYPITHISIYFLMVHEHTPLYYKIKKGRARLLPDDKIVDLYDRTIDYLAEKGIQQYEISNFARPGKESLHNKSYWNRTPYKGFGIGAASFDGKKRFTNIKNLSRYLEAGENMLEQLVSTDELLTPEQEFIEEIMLGLRQNVGLDLHHMLYLNKTRKEDDLLEKISTLKKHRLLTEHNGQLRLTRRGMALENEVVTSLL